MPFFHKEHPDRAKFINESRTQVPVGPPKRKRPEAEDYFSDDEDSQALFNSPPSKTLRRDDVAKSRPQSKSRSANSTTYIWTRGGPQSKSDWQKPEPKPVNEKIPIWENSPKTATNLQVYTEVALRCHGIISKTDEKVNPSKYGSKMEKDLGLCFNTFFTADSCNFGSKCLWRHQALTQVERDWIVALGGERPLAWMDCCWDAPKTPEDTAWFPCLVYDRLD